MNQIQQEQSERTEMISGRLRFRSLAAAAGYLPWLAVANSEGGCSKLFASSPLSNSQHSTSPPHPDKTTSESKPAGIQTLLQKFIQSGWIALKQ
jgi:hypothetical protein